MKRLGILQCRLDNIGEEDGEVSEAGYNSLEECPNAADIGCQNQRYQFSDTSPRVKYNFTGAALLPESLYP